MVRGILLNPEFPSKEPGISEIAPVRLAISQRFDFCSWSSQSYCVIDGDTIRYAGTKIRIEDIDTPEIHDYKCDSELDRGLRAKSRLLELINAGPFEIVYSGGRDEDQYGRKLRRVVRNGLSLENCLSMKVSPDVMRVAAAPGVYRNITAFVWSVRLANQIPHTEFSKRRQFDCKIIGIKADGAAGNVELKAFGQRQRGTEISVY